MPSSVRLTTAALVFTFAGIAPATEPPALLRFIPTPVNAVAVLNVESILRTPRAQREGWSQMPTTEYLAGAVPVNTAIQRILCATEFVPGHPGHGGGLAVAAMNAPIDLDRLAKTFNGQIVTADETKVVDTPDGRFFIPLQDQLLGAIRTNNKQDVTRWLRYAKSAERQQQSNYLLRAVTAFGSQFHILVAVDTEDLFHPRQLKTAIVESKVPQADPMTAESVERFITALVGVRFTANITDRGIEATIRLDSNLRADRVPADVVKGFVIETLAKNGAMLEDLAAATATAEGQTVILSFLVSDGELAKILSLFVTAASGISDADVIPVAPEGVTAAATRNYFRAVNRILDDLRGKDETKATYDSAAVWYDTAANRVATLPVLNVDPDVLDYGRKVAGALQAMAGSLRGMPMKADELNAQAYTYAFRLGGMGWGWGWGMGGGGGVDTNVPQLREQLQQAANADKAKREKLWGQIGQARASTRAAMAEKYSSDFGS